MKTKHDPRHLRRIRAMQALFAWDFKRSRVGPTLKKIVFHVKQIDKLIAKAAPQWPIEKIAKIDLAILRLAIYELIFVKKEPPRVIIDEAVELAKSYGAEQSSSFVNGVLGTVYEQIR